MIIYIMADITKVEFLSNKHINLNNRSARFLTIKSLAGRRPRSLDIVTSTAFQIKLNFGLHRNSSNNGFRRPKLRKALDSSPFLKKLNSIWNENIVQHQDVESKNSAVKNHSSSQTSKKLGGKKSDFDSTSLKGNDCITEKSYSQDDIFDKNIFEFPLIDLEKNETDMYLNGNFDDINFAKLLENSFSGIEPELFVENDTAKKNFQDLNPTCYNDSYICSTNYNFIYCNPYVQPGLNSVKNNNISINEIEKIEENNFGKNRLSEHDLIYNSENPEHSLNSNSNYDNSCTKGEDKNYSNLERDKEINFNNDYNNQVENDRISELCNSLNNSIRKIDFYSSSSIIKGKVLKLASNYKGCNLLCKCIKVFDSQIIPLLFKEVSYFLLYIFSLIKISNTFLFLMLIQNAF